MFIPDEMIPKNDILVKPINIYNFLEKLFNKEIDNYSYKEDYKDLLKVIKNNILDNFKKRYFWQVNVLSEKTCEHVYGEHSKKYG